MILLLTVLLVPLIVIFLIIIIHLYSWSLELCYKCNVFGILLLTFMFNIIGTFIGCIIIYKIKNPEFKFWKIFKIKKI